MYLHVSQKFLREDAIVLHSQECNAINQKFLTGTLYKRRRSNITAIIIAAGSPGYP